MNRAGCIAVRTVRWFTLNYIYNMYGEEEIGECVVILPRWMISHGGGVGEEVLEKTSSPAHSSLSADSYHALVRQGVQ